MMGHPEDFQAETHPENRPEKDHLEDQQAGDHLADHQAEDHLGDQQAVTPLTNRRERTSPGTLGDGSCTSIGRWGTSSARRRSTPSRST